MVLVIDFETRSACDLKKHGAFVYSEDPTTDVTCLALKKNGEPPVIWKRGDPLWFLPLLEEATEIIAHNLSFEVVMWENVCVKRYGWPPLPAEKLRCSAAQGAMHAIPRALGNACAALGMEQQKDNDGYRIMMKLCKPRKPKQDEDPDGLYWNEDPADFEKLYKYCAQDTIAEEALSNALRPLPLKELEIWRLDQQINARGIQIDLDGARAMLAMVAEHETKLLKRLARLTSGAVRTAKQVEQLRNHLRGLGLDLPDLTAKTVKDALDGDNLSPAVREILEIRRSLGRSSSAKYNSMIDRASADGRVRGSLLYHGAGTGRWAGAGIQPQNFPSRIKVSASVEEMLEVVKIGGLALHDALYGDDPMMTAGALVRSVITAAEGKELVVADYSAIEGRGLAWLAGEETELKNYREGLDVYIANAAMILHKRYEEVTKEERQSPGKLSVLSCGYGGSAGAVRKFGGDVPFRLLWEGSLAGKALEDQIDEDIKREIVNPWRETHPRTVAFWYDLERACMDAVANPGTVETCRGASFSVRDKFLMCRLPSGRLLFYYDPKIMAMKTSWGEMKDCVTYMTVDSLTKKWVRTNTYGGKISENLCQSICRDIMAEAMLRLEEAGYPIVMTVHDEIVCEVPIGFGSVEEFERIMCQVPAWATGFPIAAAGWRGKRYRK
jgi:DNA polymerase